MTNHSFCICPERPAKRLKPSFEEELQLQADVLCQPLARTSRCKPVPRQQSISSTSWGISSDSCTDEVPHSETESPSEGETDSDSDVSSVDYESEVFGCWEAKQKLSSGNNGQVYVGQLLGSPMDIKVALKIEKRSPRHSHLKTELKVFEKVRELPGFPKVYDQGQLSRTLWMAMELLGPSLRTLYDRYRFDEDLTLFLGQQMLERLQTLHSKNYVHLSVKPDNFCLQVDEKGQVVVNLIDFGRCEKYMNGAGHHISYKNNKGGPFSRWYHSAGALKGKRQSRRDDLQSLSYCLVLFTIGDSFVDWREHLKDPTAVDVADHYRDRLPSWLFQFVRYCSDLDWSEAPDYEKLRKIITSRLTNTGRLSAIDLCLHAYRRHFRRLAS